MNTEHGFVLPTVLVAIAIGTLLLGPFLAQASTSLTTSRDFGQSIDEQHSADAGIEHAIWDLAFDDLATQFSNPGDAYNYDLGETVNGIIPDITVTLTGTPTYSILSVADSRTIEARVNVSPGNATILDWKVR